jgi:eukaryotic-like serine/threonine-protein kinase
MTTPEPILHGLKALGILSTSEVESLRPQAESDPAQMVEMLIRTGRLTRFQADLLMLGESESLMIGNYLLLDDLGHGGMGQVFRARHQRMKRDVALKILPLNESATPEMVHRFEREIEAVAKLSHPNIVTAHDADEAGGVHFLVMELVPGRDLGGLVKQHGPLPVDEAIGYVIQAAQGLAHAHAAGVLHRDVKPSNLLRHEDGTVKVSDFGLARLQAGPRDGFAPTRPQLTHTSTLLGTVDFLAPEQARNIRDADHRADIYSLGCTLHYLLTGKPVYGGKSVMQKVAAHQKQAVPSLRTDLPEISPELDGVFQRLLAKKPADRPQSMQEVIDLLRPLATAGNLSSGSYSITRSMRTAPVVTASPDRRRLYIAAGIASAIVATVAVLVIWMNRGDASAGSPRRTTAQRTTTAQRPADAAPAPETPPAIPATAASDPPATASSASPPSDVAPSPSTPVQPSIAQPALAEHARQQQAAWAERLMVPIETTNSLGMKLRLVPPGEFMMGTSADEIAAIMEEARAKEYFDWYILPVPLEGPRHAVTLTRPFALGVHEVTRGQFRQFVDATQYRTDAERDGQGGYGYTSDRQRVKGLQFLWNTDLGFETKHTDDHPVVNVSWNDAVAFCDWLSQQEAATYRLPTEAEWEYACRGGTTTRYYCGDDDRTLGDFAWFGINAMKGPSPVGLKTPNAYGLCDMHGNVWEWCQDWHGEYPSESVVDPTGPSEGQARVMRGGGFDWLGPGLRSANRNSVAPTARHPSEGFRVLREYP